jgi:hypothetical protein
MANALEIARRGNVRLFRISPSLVTGSLSTMAVRSILKTNEACEGSRRTTKCEDFFKRGIRLSTAAFANPAALPSIIV